MESNVTLFQEAIVIACACVDSVVTPDGHNWITVTLHISVKKPEHLKS
jgi:hypothetical protein